MKKIILLACAALIVAGVVLMLADRRDSAPAATPPPATDFSERLDYARVPDGIPEQIVEYEGFRVSFNPDTHVPNWVAWELLGSETDGPVKRSDNFWHDEAVEGCAFPSDYVRSGYDRGHLCPAADQKWSVSAMNDCFSMANMAPQNHSLNSGAWATLENKERVWARRDSAIVIIAGPVYSDSDRATIGDTGVRVPGAFFKVLIAPYLPEPRGIGFVYPNMSSPGNMANYSMPIDEVERLTGIDFFPALPDGLEERIEAEASFREWDRR